MSLAKVSIVVPVYKVEKYLRQCLDSLVAQTYPDIEVVVVNDGSPDKSHLILAEYEAQHPHLFRVFTTPNRGVGHARNFGAQQSTGDYILFVDSDDWVEPEICERLVEKAQRDDNDIVLCGRYDCTEEAGGEVKRKAAVVVPVNHDFCLCDYPFELAKITPFPWDKLFKRSLALANPFDEKLRFEDMLFVYTLLPQATRIGVVEAPLYNYRRSNVHGFLNNFSAATFDVLIVCRQIVAWYQEHGHFDAFADELEYVCTRHIFFRFASFFKLRQRRTALDEKMRLITEAHDLLDTLFPHWRNNRYLRYSATAAMREKVPLYASKSRLKRHLRWWSVAPKSVLTAARTAPAKKAKKAPAKKKTSLASRLKKRLRVLTRWYKPVGSLRYLGYSASLPIASDAILFESKHGDDLAGNISRMILALHNDASHTPVFQNYRIFLAVRPGRVVRISALLQRYELNRVQLILMRSEDYYRTLATAGTLVTDTSFPPWFIKRPDQTYLNTWHGTPLKLMGRVVPKREYALGNVQRNFAMADYLLYQQSFSHEVFFNGYMLKGLHDGKVLVSGYPRNSAFFDVDRRQQIRAECGISEDTQIIVYMPTWRGLLTKKENAKQVRTLQAFFDSIELELSETQRMFVKLHPYVKGRLRYGEYIRIQPFPDEYETYDFLNASDALVTDYSSIMFDYAVSQKKIVLFTYDKEEYLEQRGMYLSLDELGLPMAAHVPELIDALYAPIRPTDSFRQRFCPHDSADTASRVCETILTHGDVGLPTVESQANHHPKALVHLLDLNRQNTTTRIFDALNELAETLSWRLFVSFKPIGARAQTQQLSLLRPEVGYIPLGGDTLMLPNERRFWRRVRNRMSHRDDDALLSFAERERRRHFGAANFDAVFVFGSLDRLLLKVFQRFSAAPLFFCFSCFNSERFEKSKSYRRLVLQNIALLHGAKAVWAPDIMAEIPEMKRLATSVPVRFCDVQNVDIKEIFKGLAEP